MGSDLLAGIVAIEGNRFTQIQNVLGDDDLQYGGDRALVLSRGAHIKKIFSSVDVSLRNINLKSFM